LHADARYQCANVMWPDLVLSPKKRISAIILTALNSRRVARWPHGADYQQAEAVIRPMMVYLPPEDIAALDAGKRRHLFSVTGKEQYFGGLEQRLTH
jgi:hypothetical protein